MKFKFPISLIFIVFIFFGLSSCGDDAIDCNETAINNEFQQQIDRVTTAATNFGSDPSTQNCNSYLDAIDDYIDRLRDLEDCANEVGQGAEFRDAIDEIDSERELLSC